MATNTILTDAKITKEALSVLHNTLGFTKSVNREYSGEFANTGAKIGQSVNVRKPNRYAVQQGPTEDQPPRYHRVQHSADPEPSVGCSDDFL